MKQLKNQSKCALGRVMRGHVPSLGRSVLLPGHSEQDKERSLYRQGESGRSMVEMLGVLAIIGVLSVGGIAGYTTAMNKHRANELLQQASLRAVVVSIQIQRGAEAPILGEFTGNTVGGAKFTGLANWNKNTDKRFSLTLENVPAEICTQMKASVGSNSIIRGISQNCTTITYNNDLSPTAVASDYKTEESCTNAGKEWCSTNTCADSCGNECMNTCQDGATCVNGYCECAEGIWQSNDNSGNGSCIEITQGDCKTNADCTKGEYCKIEGKWENSCAVPTKGTRTTLDNGTEATYKGKTFLYSSSDMTWWGASNWCLAHGKSLALLSDLGITKSGYCSGSNCTGADWDGLTTTFGDRYFWMNDRLVPCKSVQVNLRLRDVNAGIGRNSRIRALCK